MDGEGDGPIPWGYRSGDSASTRALGRTWKYGDDEDLGASRIGFTWPKPKPPAEPATAAAASHGAVDALEHAQPMPLPDASAQRPAEVDGLLQQAVEALLAKPHPMPNAAVTHLTQVIEASPNCQPALKLRAAAHCMLAHYRQALEDADAALFLAPMDEVCWLWKASAHDHLHEYAEAVASYRSGLQYEPTNARLQKGYVEAVKSAEKAGRKRDTLQFRGTRTLRDSEFAFTSSQVTASARASATAPSGTEKEETPGLTNGVPNPVSFLSPHGARPPSVTVWPAQIAAKKAQLAAWRKESEAEVAASLEVGTPTTLNLVTWLGQDVNFLREYYAAGGQYEVELDLIIDNAIRQLDVFFPGKPHAAEQAERPAIIFDVDETALTSVPRGREHSFRTIPELEHLWVVSASAPAVGGVLRLFKWIREHRPEVEIFFLSGRRRKEFHATEFNLKRAGYVGYSGLLVREGAEADLYTTVAEFKCEQRKDLEERGYTIVATVGDQWSDFGGGSTGYMVKLPNYLYTIE